MIWKHEAMDKLRQYEARKQALTNILSEIKRLELDMQGIRSADPDSSSVRGIGTSREDVMLNNIVHRQELDNALAQTKIWVDTVENALSILTPEEYILLDRFYIHPEKKAADRLAGELHADVKTVYRWKDDAILKFTKALYGVPET